MSTHERACENHRKVCAAARAILVVALTALPLGLPLTFVAPVSADQPNPEAAPAEHAVPAGEAHASPLAPDRGLAHRRFSRARSSISCAHRWRSTSGIVLPACGRIS